ncbi:MAG: NUDIX hydrolase [Candidatus Peribacteraceae bacterium]|nr:NUDIX hydrolase [Candidatus Peribacteraceae bacterium]
MSHNIEYKDKITCGAFIVDVNYNMLICHATGFRPDEGWGVPKGLMDDGEDRHKTAIRELEEETGIIIENHQYNVFDIGAIRYPYKNKTLHGFLFTINGIIDDKLVCDSFFTKKGISLPEVDEFRWVPIMEALDCIQAEQSRLFGDYGLQRLL